MTTRVRASLCVAAVMVALCAIASLSQQVFAAETIATPLAVTVQRAMAPDSSATTFSQVDGSQPGVSTPVSLLMTMDGEVVWARNCDTKRAVASTIKMLNALVVMDRAKLDDQVTVPPKAASIPDGGVGLVAGQRFTVRQLLEMMLVASANDAAETLAISVSGNETDFVAAMNAKAASLGLDSTHATDPHGLGKTEVSTARDLSVLARAVMAQPELREIVLGRSVSVSKPSGKSARVDATNELLGRYPGIEGVKTGFTNASGYCFVGAAKRGDVELLGVVLGANSNPARFSQMRTLLDWGFSRVRHERVVASSTVLASVPVSGGDTSTVGVRAAEDLAALTVAGGDEAAVQLELPQVVAAPVTSGQVLGTVEVVRRGTVVARTALVAAGPVPAVAGGRAIAPLPALVRPTTFAGELGAIVAEVFSSAKL